MLAAMQGGNTLNVIGLRKHVERLPAVVRYPKSCRSRKSRASVGGLQETYTVVHVPPPARRGGADGSASSPHVTTVRQGRIRIAGTLLSHGVASHPAPLSVGAGTEAHAQGCPLFLH
jgi:hypothetical protein